MNRYVLAYSMVLSEAPQNLKIGSLKIKEIRRIAIPANIVKREPVKIAFEAFEESFFPWQMLKKEATPSPNPQAKALAITMIGKTTPVAAFP